MTLGSRLVLGSADLRDDAITAPLLDRFHEAGGRSLDLANVYADGESAPAIGAGSRHEASCRDGALRKGCHPRSAPVARSARGRQGALRPSDSTGSLSSASIATTRQSPSTAFAEALSSKSRAAGSPGSGSPTGRLSRSRALHADLNGHGDRFVAFSNHFSLGEMVTPTWPGCLSMTKADIAALAEDGVPGARLGEPRGRLFCRS